MPAAFPLQCLPSMSSMGLLTARSKRKAAPGPSRRLITDFFDRLSHLVAALRTGENPSSAEEPPTAGNEGGRIRRDYLQRLGVGAAQCGAPRTTERLRLQAAAAAVTAVGQEVTPHPVPPKIEMVKDDFRVSFLRKLSYQRVLLPVAQRPPKSQTVIIFDWDDTLLCTTFLNSRGDRPLSADAEARVREIAKVAQNLLEMATRLGRTFIVTNAMDGWVELSSARWVPELLPALRNVHIISARTKFENLYPTEIHQWKVQAFLEVQRQLHAEVVTNLLSVGDSDYEMEAAHVMGKQFAQARIKTIKLQGQPSPEDLLKELVLVQQKFERIVENARDLKVCLERKVVGGGAAKPAAIPAAG